MEINSVIHHKLNTLEQVLGELKSLGQVTEKRLNDNWQMRRAVERDLQVLVEIVIDICQRFISLSGQAPATTGSEAIERCIQMGILSKPDPYQKMVQFRNFIVHRYEKVDTGILVDMVNRRLADFEKFRQEVLTYVVRR